MFWRGVNMPRFAALRVRGARHTRPRCWYLDRRGGGTLDSAGTFASQPYPHLTPPSRHPGTHVDAGMRAPALGWTFLSRGAPRWPCLIQCAFALLTPPPLPNGGGVCLCLSPEGVCCSHRAPVQGKRRIHTCASRACTLRAARIHAIFGPPAAPTFHATDSAARLPAIPYL